MEYEDVEEIENDFRTITPKTRGDWRIWLEQHCQSEKKVRLIIYHKGSNVPGIHLEEAIEEAVCFGWVDSKASKRDDESFYLLFSPRNPKSSWGKVSKKRAEKMMEQGLMTAFGMAVIDAAKETGTWQALDDAHNGIIPEDLQVEFKKNENAYRNFQAFSPASKRIILEWILKAKRQDTRQRRIMQTVESAARNIKVRIS